MGQDELTPDQSLTRHDRNRDLHSSGDAAAPGGLHRKGAPLFKRLGVSKEWRAKDNAVG